jgi:hypothetical protein
MLEIDRMPLFVPVRKNEEDFFVLKELVKAIKGAKPEPIDEKFTKLDSHNTEANWYVKFG